jgi:hypothetical protein
VAGILSVQGIPVSCDVGPREGIRRGFFDIDWKKTLSSQMFPVKKDAVIFGFSLGAVMARLISQDYECAKIVLASMTPLHSFKDKKIKSQLVDLLGENFVDDISKKLRPEHRARKQFTLYGDREGTSGDIIVPKTGHRLNARYNKEIVNLL